jgi:hypothetical protein
VVKLNPNVEEESCFIPLEGEYNYQEIEMAPLMSSEDIPKTKKIVKKKKKIVRQKP